MFFDVTFRWTEPCCLLVPNLWPLLGRWSTRTTFIPVGPCLHPRHGLVARCLLLLLHHLGPLWVSISPYFHLRFLHALSKQYHNTNHRPDLIQFIINTCKQRFWIVWILTKKKNLPNPHQINPREQIMYTAVDQTTITLWCIQWAHKWRPTQARHTHDNIPAPQVTTIICTIIVNRWCHRAFNIIFSTIRRPRQVQIFQSVWSIRWWHRWVR